MPPLLPLCYANALFPTSSSAIRYTMSVSHPTLTLDWFHLTTTHMSVVASGHMPLSLEYPLATPIHCF